MTNKIKEFRRELGFSQQKFAEFAGFDGSLLGAYERGEHEPSAFNAYIIAQALGKRIDEVFFAD